MPKVRIVYRPDETIATIIPAMKSKRPNETLDEFYERVFRKAMASGGMADCDYDDVSPDTLPDRSMRDKWRGNKQTGIKIDKSIVLPHEKKQKDKDSISSELDKTSPDLLKVIKLQQKIIENNY